MKGPSNFSVGHVGMGLAGLVPALVAAAGATSASTAAHDLDVVRTVGAGFAGPGGGAFRALDLLVAAPALLLPIGTRVLRAGLASAVVTAVCGAVAFGVTRELVAIALARTFRVENASTFSPRLVTAVSTVAVLTALLGPAWQSEASAPGGAVTGALLILLALRLGVERPAWEPEGNEGPEWIPPAMLVLGLAASYEPFVFLAALAAMAPRFAATIAQARKWGSGESPRKWGAGESPRDEKARAKGVTLHALACFAAGLMPLALGVLLQRRPFEAEIAVPGPMFALLGDRSAPIPTSALANFASAQLGVLILVVCAAGAALAFYVSDARRIALPVALVAAVGGPALRVLPAAGAEPNAARFAAPVLAGLLAVFILGATMLGALVLGIARARLPFAEASAALIVVLELVLPVRSIDETTSRREARAANASSVWNDVAWGDAPPASVVLVADRGTMRRVASARAVGEMRGDLVMVPAYDVQGREGQRALLAEPKLAPLYRDMALGVPPEELSLAQLGAQRPVLATFDPKWDRALSRHLIPVGLTSRFEPEPRGTSERKKALDTFLASKDRLVRIAVAKKDSELATATATLLRARAIGMAATGERDILSRALDDLRSFAPEDAVGATLVRRIVTSKGSIDVHDLAP